MNYNGVDVSSTGFMPSKEEIGKYIECIIQKRNCKMSDIAKLNLTLEGENSVAMDYELKERRFERIRRITGYLTGTIDRWNDAKKAELNDRVKHS